MNSDDQTWDAYNRFHFTCDKSRFQKIFSRLESFRMVAGIPGDIVDAGAFKGISTIQFAQMLEAYQPNSRSKVISFDTFESKFDHLRPDEAASAHELMANYQCDAYTNLMESLERLHLAHRVNVVKGDILETLPKYVSDNPGFRISLLHCDLDAYRPTLAALRAAWPRLVPGGIAVFDEYAIESWGESDAVDEFFRESAPGTSIQLLPISQTPTAYCRKQSF
jgi:predicted O-methyltransferase YrrM